MREGDVMRVALCMLASGSWLFGAVIDGNVFNATANHGQPNVIVSLMQPGAGGMQTLTSVKTDADGKFRIDKDYPPGPAIIQALYQGATYNTVLTPGSPTSGVQVRVFDSTKAPGTAKVLQDMLLFEPTADSLKVTETMVVKNDTQLTFQDPTNGSAQFYVPEPAGEDVRVTVQAPDGMPIQRPGEKTGKPGLYKISYPLKPGETRFDLNYSLPKPDAFAGRNPHPGAPLRIVTPSTVTVSGEGIESLGQEPTTKAHIYGIKGDRFEAKIEGIGALRTGEESGEQPKEDTGQPPIEQVPPRVYTRLGWVLGLALAILLLGGTLLFRKGTA
jgi:hypothetical protein